MIPVMEKKNNLKNTLVVNLFGAPGVGKSTIRAGVFSELKWNKIDCEEVTEFAKDLVWEQRHMALSDELYIFSEQNFRFNKLLGQVGVIVTDRPVLLSIPYVKVYSKIKDKQYIESFKNLVYYYHEQQNSLNIFLERVKPYNPNGRYQTEKESNLLNKEFKNTLLNWGVEFTSLPGQKESVKIISELIYNKLNKK